MMTHGTDMLIGVDAPLVPVGLTAPARPSAPACRAFPGRADQVAHARRFVRRAVGPGCPATGDVVLLTPELVTNALLHTRTGRAAPSRSSSGAGPARRRSR
jgi:hypothetical protein